MKKLLLILMIGGIIMIAIKKIEVTPIDQNIGKIIDSTSTTDDKTKNTYSARVIDEKTNKFAVLTGTVANTELSLGGKALNYPDGFSIDNCVVISAFKKQKNASIWTNYYSVIDDIDFVEETYSYSVGMNIQLAPASIKLITLTNYVENQKEPDEKWGYDYRVVLMKID